MNEPNDENEFDLSRGYPDYIDELIAQGVRGERVVILEGPHGDVNINTRGSAETKEFEPVKVIREVVVQKRRGLTASVVAAALILLLLTFVQVCVLDDLSQLRSDVRRLDAEVQRVRTPAKNLNETENGILPVPPVLPPKEKP